MGSKVKVSNKAIDRQSNDGH